MLLLLMQLLNEYAIWMLWLIRLYVSVSICISVILHLTHEYLMTRWELYLEWFLLYFLYITGNTNVVIVIISWFCACKGSRLWSVQWFNLLCIHLFLWVAWFQCATLIQSTATVVSNVIVSYWILLNCSRRRNVRESSSFIRGYWVNS